MTVEKVYDELYGMIDDLKKQIAAGGGGSSVTITPELESGVKIADYTIGSTEGSLFAPEGGNELDFSAPMKIGKLGNDEVYLARAVKTTATGTGASFSIPTGVTGIKEIMSVSGMGLVGSGSQYFIGQWFSAPYRPNVADDLYIVEGLRYDPSTNAFIGGTRSGVSLDKIVVLFVYTIAAPAQQTKKTTKKK